MGGRSGPPKIRHCIQIWCSLWLGKEEKRNRRASQNERATVRFYPSINTHYCRNLQLCPIDPVEPERPSSVLMAQISCGVFQSGLSMRRYVPGKIPHCFYSLVCNPEGTFQGSFKGFSRDVSRESSSGFSRGL